MRGALELLLASVVSIVCLVFAYLFVEHGHPVFAVACMVLAYLTACDLVDDGEGEKNADSEKKQISQGDGIKMPK